MLLGHKMGETCCGRNTKSRGNELSFLTRTQTHVFYNHSNGYDRLSTAYAQRSVIAEKPISQWFGGLATVLNGEDFIFYFCLLGLLIK
jgi:hypothetical protein